jgi:hypothetical protein
MENSMNMKETLVEKLTASDKERPRSLQTLVGPSEIGGCARRVWHRVNGTEVTNPDTLRLAAIMGTAIHSLIESVFAGDDRYRIETEVLVDDVTGHIDLIDTKTNTVWDWKTTTKKSLAYFPSEQQRDQVHLYGYLANANGIQVDTVGLVAIARDGNENDIVEHSEPYNEAIALNALAHYHSIREQFEPPAPEKDADFCANYCPFFGACTGIVNGKSGEPIENPEIASLAKEYKELQGQVKQIDSQLDFIKEQLEGTQGITSNGITIKWSQVAGRQSTDEAEVEKLLGFVPKKQGNGYLRLTVK